MTGQVNADAAARVFLAHTEEHLVSYLEACVHCGQCADACHFYEASGDPRHTPAYKLFPIAKAYRRQKFPLSLVRAASHRRRSEGVGRAAVRHLHHVRALHHDLPDGHRHRLHRRRRAAGFRRRGSGAGGPAASGREFARPWQPAGRDRREAQGTHRMARGRARGAHRARQGQGRHPAHRLLDRDDEISRIHRRHGQASEPCRRQLDAEQQGL